MVTGRFKTLLWTFIICMVIIAVIAALVFYFDPEYIANF